MLLKTLTKSLIKAHIYALGTGPLGMNQSRASAIKRALDEYAEAHEEKEAIELEPYVPKNYTEL